MGTLTLRPLLLRSVVISAAIQVGLALWFLWSAKVGHAGERCRVYRDCTGLALTYTFVFWPFLFLAFMGGVLALGLRVNSTRLRRIWSSAWLVFSWSYVLYWVWPFFLKFKS